MREPAAEHVIPKCKRCGFPTITCSCLAGMVDETLEERIKRVRAKIKEDVPELFLHDDPVRYYEQYYQSVIFNAWPQCPTKPECNKDRHCNHECSSVKGIRLHENRCPYDHWKPARDIG